MEVLISILIGLLFGAGVFCLLRRSIMKVIIGIMLLSQAVNLIVFSAGGLTEEAPVFIQNATKSAMAGHADPLPQALVLTAIVIGFGLVVFSISLLLKANRELGTDDLQAFDSTDRLS